MSVSLAQSTDAYEKVRLATEATAQRQRETVAEAVESSVRKQRAAVAQAIQRFSGTQNVEAKLLAKKPGKDASPFFATHWIGTAPSWPVSASPMNCERLSQVEASVLVGQAARREGLTPDLLRAVIRKESSFFPCAVSSKGAQGLMQLMPETAQDLQVRNPFNPKESIDGGAKLLKQLLARYSGDLALTLGAYNAGPARVDAAAGVPALPETQAYVEAILGELERR